MFIYIYKKVIGKKKVEKDFEWPISNHDKVNLDFNRFVFGERSFIEMVLPNDHA